MAIQSMNKPLIDELGRFYVAGSPQLADPSKMCPGLSWDRLKELKQRAPLDSPHDFEVGLRVYPDGYPDNGGLLHCMAGIPFDAPPSTIPLGYFLAEVPENRYAVFDVPSLDDLVTSFDYIYQDWLPNSGYVVGGYIFEKFTHVPEFSVQIWVPVTSKPDVK